MNVLKCFKCGEDIFFDDNKKSQKGKLIPLDPDTEQPHNCQKSNYKESQSLAQQMKDAEKRDSERYKIKLKIKNIIKDIEKYPKNKTKLGVKIVKEWDQKSKTIEQLLDLKSNDFVLRYGYEHLISAEMYNKIKNSYTLTALSIRTQPDWLVSKDGHIFFVEFKSNVKALEAIQLFFNQQRANSGIDIKYLFPNGKLVDCLDIPFENESIIVPLNYEYEFMHHLWPVLKHYNKKDPEFIGKKMRPPISGDPFIYYSGWQ